MKQIACALLGIAAAVGLRGRLVAEDVAPAAPAGLSLPAGGPGDAGPGDAGITEKLGEKAALDAPLRGEDGKSVTLRQLIDKPTILTLNYFSCAGICTPLLNGLVDMLNEIPIEPGKDFQVITVSFDPRDTPEVASRKRENYLKQMKRPFPPQAWRFLTGEASATRQIADSVGFKYKAQGKDFIHAGAIMFLSPEGKVTRYMYGMSFLPSDVQMAVGEALRGEARPTISRFLRFCFSSDPASGREVFNMARVVGAFTLILVVGFVIFLAVKGRVAKARSPS